MANSSITLLSSMEFCKKFVFNRQLSLGDFKEPLITSANIIKQTIVGPPFMWRWNRVVTGFVTVAGVQDYVLGNWSATTALALSFRVIDSNGNSQRVTTAGTTGGSLPSWNASTSGTTSDGSVVWTNDGPIPNASASYTFGWIENATVKDTAQNPAKWNQISPKIDLSLDSSSSRPGNISAELDDGSGNITFRLMPVPDRAYPIAITIQQKPTLFSSLNAMWNPIPDEYSYIYQTGLLALMFLFADDPRFATMNQKFVAHLLGAAQGISDTERNIFLNNWMAVTGQPVLSQMNIQQGSNVRGSY